MLLVRIGGSAVGRIVLLVTDAINRRLWSVKGWLRPLMAPLVLVCIVVILGIYIETIDRGFWVGLFSFWDEQLWV